MMTGSCKEFFGPSCRTRTNINQPIVQPQLLHYANVSPKSPSIGMRSSRWYPKIRLGTLDPHLLFIKPPFSASQQCSPSSWYMVYELVAGRLGSWAAGWLGCWAVGLGPLLHTPVCWRTAPEAVSIGRFLFCFCLFLHFKKQHIEG